MMGLLAAVGMGGKAEEMTRVFGSERSGTGDVKPWYRLSKGVFAGKTKFEGQISEKDNENVSSRGKNGAHT
jgi:hypothetical protein